MYLPTLLVLGMVLPALTKPIGCPPDAPNLNSMIRNEISKLQDKNIPQAPTCDLSKVQIPQAPEPLPVIPEGQQLLGVTIGRGTQVSIVNTANTCPWQHLLTRNKLDSADKSLNHLELHLRKPGSTQQTQGRRCSRYLVQRQLHSLRLPLPSLPHAQDRPAAHRCALINSSSGTSGAGHCRSSLL